MKKTVFSILVATCTLAGCWLDDSNISVFIPGTYARVFKTQFANGNDTLLISVLPEETARYKIEHHTTYIPVLDGVEQLQKTITETWVAVYNENTKQLLEQRKGKIFSFSRADNCLYYGTGKYDKIK